MEASPESRPTVIVRPAMTPHRFLAYCPDHVGLSATGENAAEALEQLRRRLLERLPAGAESIDLDVRTVDSVVD